MKPLYKKSFVFLSILLIILSNVSFVSADYNLEYDNNGNLIQDDKFSYEYNSFNQLIKIKESNNLIAEYSYDQNGERIKKAEYSGRAREPVSITYYIGDFVRTVKGNKVSDSIYYYNNGQLVAKEENNKKYYYHPDYLGSTNLITDENGNLVSELSYLPFGESLTDNNERFTFTGQESDKESDLMYYGARYYDPSLGRFIQPDSVIQDIYNPQNLNRYSYVLNNPYKYIDPSGNEPTQVQVTTPIEVISLITNIENKNPTFTQVQVIKEVANGYKQETAYLVTNEGVVDLKHFFANAKISSSLPSVLPNNVDRKVIGRATSIIGGYAVEGYQLFSKDSLSAFSYEDLHSNVLGARFGSSLDKDKKVSEQFSGFSESIGVSNDPKNTDIYKQFPQDYSKISGIKVGGIFGPYLSWYKLRFNPFKNGTPNIKDSKK